MTLKFASVIFLDFTLCNEYFYSVHRLSNIILPLGVTHVSGLHELLVHREGA